MDLTKVAALDPTKKAFSLLTEFKNFALKGNVIDLPVGVISGRPSATSSPRWSRTSSCP